MKRFKNKDIPESAKRGYVVGLDGRKIYVPSQHLTMGAYLQGFETVVIRYAMKLWHDSLREANIPFFLCGTIHDEWQTMTYKEYGDIVGQHQVDAIKKAGVLLKSNCPLDGEYRTGHSWAESH